MNNDWLITQHSFHSKEEGSLEPWAWSNVLEKENRFTQTQAKTVKMSRDPHMDW